MNFGGGGGTHNFFFIFFFFFFFFFFWGGGHICANYWGARPPVPPYSYGPVFVCLLQGIWDIWYPPIQASFLKNYLTDIEEFDQK